MPERPASAVVPLARLDRGTGGRQDGQEGQAGRSADDRTAVVRVGARLRSARAVSAAAAVRRAVCGAARTTARWRRPTPRSRRCSTMCGRRGRPTLVVVTGDHGEALGDHGEQSHGLFAYESTLRVPLIIARGGGRESDSESRAVRRAAKCRASPRGTSTSSRRCSTRPAQPVPADLPGRTLLPAAERRGGVAAASVVLRSDVRDAEPRLGAAHRRARRSRQVHRSADCPSATTSRSDPGGGDEPAGPRRRSAIARSPRVLRDFDGAGARTARRRGCRRRPRRLRALGYVSGQRAREDARTRKPTIRSSSSTLDDDVHRAVEAFGAGRVADADADLSARHRAASRHGDRVPSPRVHAVAARRSSRRDRRAARARSRQA